MRARAHGDCPSSSAWLSGNRHEVPSLMNCLDPSWKAVYPINQLAQIKLERAVQRDSGHSPRGVLQDRRCVDGRCAAAGVTRAMDGHGHGSLLSFRSLFLLVFVRLQLLSSRPFRFRLSDPLACHGPPVLLLKLGLSSVLGQPALSINIYVTRL